MKPLIAIATCHKYRHRTEAQRTTWVFDSPVDADIRFFYGEGGDTLAADEIKLPVGDGYADLPAKTQAIARWARANGYENMLKLDDDTYLQVHRALESDYKKFAYVGRLRGPSGDYPAPYCSGFAYWLGAAAMEVIATAPLTEDIAEDRWVANTLLRYGISPTADYRYVVTTSGRNAPSGKEGPREGNCVIACCEYEPEGMRKIHEEWKSKRSVRFFKPPNGRLANVAIMVKTFLRDGYLFNTLSGLQRTAPESKIVVVDDGFETRKKIVMYSELRERGNSCVWMPYDSGFGAKANAALEYLDREFVLIACDDFDFHEKILRTHLERMVAFLSAHPEFAIVSGRVNGNPYEAKITEADGEVWERPGYHYEVRSPEENYCATDLTVNFSLIRRSILGMDKIHWDADVKIGGGEHGAFFLDVQRAGHKVAYLPGVNIREQTRQATFAHPTYTAMRNRARLPGRPCLVRRGIKKWHLQDGRVEIC